MPKRPGRKSAAQTPAPKAEQIKGSSKNPKGSAASSKAGQKIRLSREIINTLTEKAKKFNEENPRKKVTLGTLKAVFRRGSGAYSSSHRPIITGGKPNSRTAWSYARVNTFLAKKAGKPTKAAYVQDDDLLMDGGEVMAKGGLLGQYAFVDKNMGNLVGIPDKGMAKIVSVSKKLQNTKQNENANKLEIKLFNLIADWIEDSDKKDADALYKNKETFDEIKKQYPAIFRAPKNKLVYRGIELRPQADYIQKFFSDIDLSELVAIKGDLGNDFYFVKKPIKHVPRLNAESWTTELKTAMRFGEDGAVLVTKTSDNFYMNPDFLDAVGSEVLGKREHEVILIGKNVENVHMMISHLALENFLDNLSELSRKKIKGLEDYFAKGGEVIEPEQIKIADGTNTTFDGGSPDIRYGGGGLTAVKLYGTFGIAKDIDDIVLVAKEKDIQASKLSYNEFKEQINQHLPDRDLGFIEMRLAYNELKKTEFSAGGDVDVEEKITCPQCGWSWKLSESEPHDATICHKCGFDSTRKKPKKMKATGNCYQSAADFAIGNYYSPKEIEFIGDPFVVHAEVSGQGKLEGIRYGHAWVEDDVNVYDFSNNREITLPKEIYYQIGEINPEDPKKYRKYTFQEAREKMLETGTYGCWDLETDYREGGQVYNDQELLKKWKDGEKIGFSATAHLKAKGLIPRSDGKKRKSLADGGIMADDLILDRGTDVPKENVETIVEHTALHENYGSHIGWMLLLRLLEFAREDANSDVQLHQIIENLQSLPKDRMLTMADYDAIIAGIQKNKKVENKQEKTNVILKEYKQGGVIEISDLKSYNRNKVASEGYEIGKSVYLARKPEGGNWPYVGKVVGYLEKGKYKDLYIVTDKGYELPTSQLLETSMLEKHGFKMEDGGITPSDLEQVDLDNLDAYERFMYDNLSKNMDKRQALQVIINGVEGDYSQLSDELLKYAEYQQFEQNYASQLETEIQALKTINELPITLWVESERHDTVAGWEFTDVMQAVESAKNLGILEDSNDYEIRNTNTGRLVMNRRQIVDAALGKIQPQEFAYGGDVYEDETEVVEYQSDEYIKEQKDEAKSILYSRNMSKMQKIMYISDQMEYATDKLKVSQDGFEQNIWEEVLDIWRDAFAKVERNYCERVKPEYKEGGVTSDCGCGNYYAKGGLAYGNSHAKGGMPMTVKSTGQNIEIEGGEGVVNKKSMQITEKITLNGEKMTPCEAVSTINEMGGGVKFKCDDVKEIIEEDGNF